MKYTVEIIDKYEDFLALEEIWNDLLTRSPTNTYFMRWEWVSNWWDIYSRADDELCIISIKEENIIISITPLYTRQRRVAYFYTSKSLMFLGTQYHGHGDVCSDYLDFIYLKDHIEDETLINIIFEQINNKVIYDEMYLSKIDPASETMQLFIQKFKTNKTLIKIREEYVSPYIKLPGSWDAYMDSISASMRYKIRREKRKLEKQFDFKFRHSKNQLELKSDYRELVRLHTDWWKSRGKVGAFSNPDFNKFHQRLLPIMMENQHLDLHLMYDGERNLAVFYLIKYNNKVYFYQSGIEINSKKCAFGYIMHSYCINDAIKAGLSTYDFLPDINTNGYKQKYTKNNREIADIYLCKNKAIRLNIFLKDYVQAIYKSFKKLTRA